MLGTGIDHADACDLHCLRDDIINTVAANCLTDSRTLDAKGESAKESKAGNPREHHLPASFNHIVKTLASIPQPFAGKAICSIGLSGALQQPLITADVELYRHNHRR